MKIIQAAAGDFEAVKRITRDTIREIYPRYYPAGAVDFFCCHHSDDRITADIASGKVYLLVYDDQAAGTVTISGNEINRLFVLPEYQHKGFGRALLDFAEQAVLLQYDTVHMDASLPAKAIYKKRGYRETEYHTIRTENGDYLCYDVMMRSKEEK
ncbi:MAG: GNAT family N-acetyltransferase [Clostridia bacterium]|nr:GNAT family N-acetyltransferase [Clostridia bacterium]